MGLSHALAVEQALEQRGVKVDFRKGEAEEPDVIRVGPHFYNTKEEIEILFREIDAISSSGELKKFPQDFKKAT
jgi:kynureninase